MVTQVLATTNEISLKGDNRGWFERHLTDNVRAAVADLPLAELRRPSSRVLLTFAEAIPFERVARRLGTVFGLGAIIPVHRAGWGLEDLERAVLHRLADVHAPSFAVRCTRSDKRFPHTSPEIERRLGRAVQERTGWPVDLSAPDLTVHVLVDVGGLYLWTDRVEGPGGLPTGVGGRAVCLMSGGIDSPVAAYLMMKRGMRLDFVHFHSMPRTDSAGVDKVRELVMLLNRYQTRSRLAVVPLLDIQEQVVAQCPPALRVLLYRRFMLRIADRIGRRLRGQSLITGEALGQVASQTIENLAAVEAAAELPVLRPLIGFDKQEIIAVARRISTYDISIQPHMDCCSFLMPDRPAIRSSARELEEAESALEVSELVRGAVAAAVVTTLQGAPWSDQALTPDPAQV